MSESGDATEARGALLWDGARPEGALFDASGEFRFFAPGVPTGPRTPEPNLVIGFIDSGTTAQHPQLLGLVRAEKTFVDGPVFDELGHGTFVMLAGVAAMGKRACGFYSAKVTRRGDNLKAKAVLAAFDWLVDNGVRSINMSLGFDRLSADVEALCKRIAATPQVHVSAAAGNLGPDEKTYPAAYAAPNIVAVGEQRGGVPTPTSGKGAVYFTPLPMSPRWAYYYEEGAEAARENRFEDARQLYGKSLADKENAGALYGLALIDIVSSRWNEAGPTITRAAQLAPESAEILQNAGVVAFMLGNDDAAIAYYNQALVVDPDNVRATVNLARALAVRGDAAGARAMLDRVRALKPDHPHISEIALMIADIRSPAP